MANRTADLPPLPGLPGVIRELRHQEAMRQGLGLALMPVFAWLSSPTPVLFMAGAFIVVLGCLVRVYASGYIVKNKQLATDGPYSLVRHPLYTGNLLVLIGFTLACGQWWAPLVAIAFWWFYYPTAISYEDRKLHRIFGAALGAVEPHRSRRHTPALLASRAGQLVAHDVRAPERRARRHRVHADLHRLDRRAGLAVPDPGPGQFLSRGYQGAVFLRGTGADRRVIKQAMGGRIARRLRVAMLRREHAAYGRVTGIPGIPRCYGLQDDGSLVLEYLPGEAYRETVPALRDHRERFFRELRDQILALHAAGVAHADLKRRGNILISAGRRSDPARFRLGGPAEARWRLVEPLAVPPGLPHGPECLGEAEVPAPVRPAGARGPAVLPADGAGGRRSRRPPRVAQAVRPAPAEGLAPEAP